jgi:hypothetical protein
MLKSVIILPIYLDFKSNYLRENKVFSFSETPKF